MGKGKRVRGGGGRTMSQYHRWTTDTDREIMLNEFVEWNTEARRLQWAQMEADPQICICSQLPSGQVSDLWIWQYILHLFYLQKSRKDSGRAAILLGKKMFLNKQNKMEDHFFLLVYCVVL